MVDIGSYVLNYVIERRLGEGGMGVVFLAQHTQLNRKAAIKALHPMYVHNPAIRERFRQEAATMAQLKHAHIVDLYDYLEEPDALYLIMEFVEGRELDDYIQNVSGPIPEERAIQLFAKMLDGFAYAHNQGIVHRDIKPSNLIITPDYNAKILDFGIAKIVDGNNKNMTKTGSRMGTVLYMSPEQVRGESVDKRSDIYALGVTFFQMLTGRPPYDEHNSTEYEVYNQIINSPLPRAKTFYPNVSERMQSILDRATAKHRAERFQSCEIFKSALVGNQLNTTSFSTTSPPPTRLSKTKPPSIKTKRNTLHHTQEEEYTINNLPPLDRQKGGELKIVFIALLALAVLLLALWNPLHWKFLEPIAIFNNANNTKEEVETPITHAQKLLEGYFDAIESRNFNNAKSYFAENVEQYFGFKNIKPIPDVQKSLEYGWKQYVKEEHIVYPETIQVETDTLGNHIVKFSYDYTFRERGEEEQTVSRAAEFRFNIDWKIYYIVNLRD